MKYLSSIILLLMMNGGKIFSQASGEVDYKYLGITFTIPEGWIGQEMGDGYLIGSNTIQGFAYLSTHQARSVAELQNQARQGIQDQNGTYLTTQGDFQMIGDHGVGASFSGTLEWKQVKAYLIGLVNPYGNGVTIMAAASPNEYSATHQDLARKIAQSIKFRQAEVPPIVQEWKQALADAKLTYRDSYYSSGLSSSDGYSTGGGYSDKIEIHLCGQGFFRYNSNSSMTVDTGGAFGSSFGGSGGDGSWNVAADANGNPVLNLNFNNGEVREYALTYQDNATYLNGKRYYRTYANDGNGPNCF